MILIIMIIMASYHAPTFNKTVAPGTLTHHCKTKMVQNTNDREMSSLQHNKKSGSVELMTNSPIHNLNTALNNYRLITAYLLLGVNLDKIMHASWEFDASSARTRRVSALDKHQNWSASAVFCLNSRAQSKYALVNLIHTRRKQTFLSIILW